MLSKANKEGSRGSVGRGLATGGGNSAEIVVVNIAVQDAPTFAFALAGVQVAGEPRFVAPFWN